MISASERSSGASDAAGVTAVRARASELNSRPLRNHAVSAGWQTSTGARVVGRSTPAALTGARTRLLTSVDLPAPVEPPTTMSSGASMLRRRGSR